MSSPGVGRAKYLIFLVNIFVNKCMYHIKSNNKTISNAGDLLNQL